MMLYFRTALPYLLAGVGFAAGLSVYGLTTMLAVLAVFFGSSFFIALIQFPRLRQQLYRRKMRGRAGWVYGFTDYGIWIPTVKIGRGSNEFDRLRAHRTAAPFGLKVYFNIPVPDAVWAEEYLHQRYAHLRFNLEWFAVTPVMWFEMQLIRWFMSK